MVQHRPASRAVRYRGKLVRLRRVAMAKPMAAPTAEGVIYHILAAAGGGIFSANRVCCTNSFPTHSEWAPGAKQRKPVPRPPQVVYLSAIAHRTRSRAVLVYHVMTQHLHLNAQHHTSRRPSGSNPSFFQSFRPPLGRRHGSSAAQRWPCSAEHGIPPAVRRRRNSPPRTARIPLTYTSKECFPRCGAW